MPQHAASLWRHRDFRTLWIGATISDFGSAITSLALPLTAVVTLQASAAQRPRRGQHHASLVVEPLRRCVGGSRPPASPDDRG